MSILCGHPTPGGPCHRKVAAPGAPCGAAHRPLPAPIDRRQTPPGPGGNPLEPATDPDSAVRARQHTARHPDTPPHTLAALINDPHPGVRAAAASHPHTPSALLAVPAADPAVRRAAARNRNTPPDVIARLVHDPTPSVGAAAIDHPNCPPEVLADLAGHPNQLYRYRVARNWSTPPDALARLAVDDDPGVRRKAGEHPACPPAGKAGRALLAD